MQLDANVLLLLFVYFQVCGKGFGLVRGCSIQVLGRSSLMVEFLNVVKYHEAEGKSVKKIQKLIGRKVLVSRQLQASYELILQELSSFETITKT